MRYGITADELHDRIIVDLRDYCDHFGVAVACHVFDNAQCRPLEQTIRMVLAAVEGKKEE